MRLDRPVNRGSALGIEVRFRLAEVGLLAGAVDLLAIKDGDLGLLLVGKTLVLFCECWTHRVDRRCNRGAKR